MRCLTEASVSACYLYPARPQGSDKDADIMQQARGRLAQERLRQAIKPHFLRREKKSIFGHDSILPLPGTGMQRMRRDVRTWPSSRGASLMRAHCVEPAKKSLPASADDDDDAAEGTVAVVPASAALPAATATKASTAAQGGLPPKKELVVWTRLTPQQLSLYQAFLKTDRVSQACARQRTQRWRLTILTMLTLRRTHLRPGLLVVFQAIIEPKSMLATLNVLLRLCCHPALISAYLVRTEDGRTELAAELPKLGEDDLDEAEPSSDEEDDENNFVHTGSRQRKKATAAAFKPPGVGRTSWTLSELLEGSGKLAFLHWLLPRLVTEGHRVLLFSQSKVMLDLTCCLLGHLVRAHAHMTRDEIVSN